MAAEWAPDKTAAGSHSAVLTFSITSVLFSDNPHKPGRGPHSVVLEGIHLHRVAHAWCADPGFHLGVHQRDLQSLVFFFSSRRRHTRFDCDWSSDVCSSD